MTGRRSAARLRRLPLALALGLLAGCSLLQAPAPPVAPVPARSPFEPAALTAADDDLSRASLAAATEASLRYFEAAGGGHAYRLGDDVYTSEQLARSVERFAELVRSAPPGELAARVRADCRSYRAPGAAVFTAYYEPVLRARLQPDARFRYPIYRMPDPALLDRLAAEGRIGGGRGVPDRAEIDGGNVLAGNGLELAWLDDPVARFFLHVQGSGRLDLEGGGTMRVAFAGTNGLEYRSVGRYMLDHGLIGPGQASASGMRAWLAAHPAERDRILFENPRYVFFRAVEVEDHEGPIGALGVPLVAGRSLATDRRFVPPGVVLYLRTDGPVVATDGALLGWRPLERFALSQDAGAAIQGAARADIFWGSGEEAGVAAGYMKQPGELYVVVCGQRPVAARAYQTE